MSLEIGDKIVYPGHGVGEIVGIESRDFSGAEETFYVINIVSNGMRIMVPVNNARNVGLRPVIGESEAGKVLSILRNKGRTNASGPWNRRHREYQEMLKSGSVYEAARVLRELAESNAVKELSFSERRLMDTVRSLVINELACAKDATSEAITEEIDGLLPRRALTAA